MKLYQDITGFDWDKGNISKNWEKHLVSFTECEEVFFNFPLFVYENRSHSEKETRYYALGKTNNERFMFLVFTIRNKLIRIISARDMNKKERNLYNEKSKENSKV